MKMLIAPIAAMVLAAGLACGDDDDAKTANGGAGTQTATAPPIDPADFSTTIDNPLFPLPPGTVFVYEGQDTDAETGERIAMRDEVSVLDERETVAGVEVVVVRDQAFEDGELVESTFDYYAQHSDGTVYYFGERVDNYEDGQIKDHGGSWLAGENGNQPGIFMPANVGAGLSFEQEKAPGVAEDRTTVIAVGEPVTVRAGDFENCIETEDVNPLDGQREYKYYCPEVGFVREEFAGGTLELIDY